MLKENRKQTQTLLASVRMLECNQKTTEQVWQCNAHWQNPNTAYQHKQLILAVECVSDR